MKVLSTTRKMNLKTLCSPITKNTKKEASLGHEGESLSSDLSERSEDNDEYDDGTGAKNNNCDIEGEGDRNTGAWVGSAEWLRFLSPSALTEALGAMAKAKASFSEKPRKSEVGKN